MAQLAEVLAKYVPEKAAYPAADIIQRYRVKVTITNTRASKYGDYRAPHNGLGHRISVNHDLNPYAFLITLLHELAHMVAHVRYGHRDIQPHGNEWKREFQILLDEFTALHIFPDDVLEAVNKYARNIKASSCSDPHLLRALKKYDTRTGESIHLLEDLEEGACFILGKDRIFKKGKKLRSRYMCKEVGTNRDFLINGLAEVSPQEY